MANYLIARLLQAISVLVLASALLFLVLHILPGDPAALVAGQNATPADLKRIHQQLGLDRSLPDQYARWIGGLVQGDFGRSLRGNRPVSGRLAQAIPPTIVLALVSLLLALLIGVPFGLAAGARPGSIWDYGLASFTALGLGIPGFYLGILALLVFTIKLSWLPPGGWVSPASDPGAAIRHLFLPAVTLGLASAAVFARFVRSAVQSSMRDDYVRTARAKGLSATPIVLRHVLPNSFIPLITVVALQTGRLLSGTVITEQVFAWPGMGRLVVDAVLQRDYLVVQGVLVVLVGIFVGVNLLADLLYGVADPRVRAS